MSGDQSFRATALRDGSRRQQVVDLLREAIVSGRLAAGQQLKQDWLSTEFEVSPAPVREALRQLESEGLVVHHPNRGVFVLEQDGDDLLGLLLPVRLAIEQFAFPKARSSLADGLGDELTDLIDQMRSRASYGDLTSINELDVAFHEAVVSYSGSTQALQLWRSVEPRIRAQIYQLAPRHRSLAEIAGEHAALLAALREGTDDELAIEVHHHIIDSAVSLLASQPNSTPTETP